MIERQQTKTKEEAEMLDIKYYKWLKEEWSENGGFISQAQAARLLGKTPTRVRQMINEKKLDGFCYEAESPLLSYSQVMKMCRLEAQKEWESFENDPQYKDEQKKLKEEWEEERLIEEAQLTEEDRWEIATRKKRLKELDEQHKQLSQSKEKIEEKMAQIDLEKKAL